MEITDLGDFKLRKLVQYKVNIMNSAFQRGIDNLEQNNIRKFKEFTLQAIAIASDIHDIISEIDDESIQEVLFERLKEFVSQARIIGEAVKEIYARELRKRMESEKTSTIESHGTSSPISLEKIHETQQATESVAALSASSMASPIPDESISSLPALEEPHSEESITESVSKSVSKIVEEEITAPESAPKDIEPKFRIPKISDEILGIIPSDMAAAYASAKAEFEINNYEKSFILFKEIAKWAFDLVEKERDPAKNRLLKRFAMQLIEIAKRVKKILNDQVPKSGVVIETSLVSVDGSIDFNLVSQKVGEFMQKHPEVLAWAVLKKNGSVAWQTQNWNLNMDGITLVMSFNNRESVYFVQNVPYNLSYSDKSAIIATNPENKGHIFMLNLGKIYIISYGLPSINVKEILSEMIEHFKN